MQESLATLITRFQDRSGIVAIVGLGYVGLPLAKAFCDAGFQVVGVDIDTQKVAALASGRTYIKHLPGDLFADPISRGQFKPTTDFAEIVKADAILICVPTPLTAHREPDLTFVKDTAAALAPWLREQQLVVLEINNLPGDKSEILKPILEQSGLRSGREFFIAYSPEREDPGNSEFSTNKIPKVIGADGPEALKLADALYSAIVPRTVLVSKSRNG